MRFSIRVSFDAYKRNASKLSYSQFERIPVSQERQERLLREQIEDITEEPSVVFVPADVLWDTVKELTSCPFMDI